MSNPWTVLGHVLDTNVQEDFPHNHAENQPISEILGHLDSNPQKAKPVQVSKNPVFCPDFVVTVRKTFLDKNVQEVSKKCPRARG
jgi:hypothetical protein